MKSYFVRHCKCYFEGDSLSLQDVQSAGANVFKVGLGLTAIWWSPITRAKGRYLWLGRGGRPFNFPKTSLKVMFANAKKTSLQFFCSFEFMLVPHPTTSPPYSESSLQCYQVTSVYTSANGSILKILQTNIFTWIHVQRKNVIKVPNTDWFRSLLYKQLHLTFDSYSEHNCSRES